MRYLSLSLCLFLVGCSYQKKIYNEVQSCQELSYQKWKGEYYKVCENEVIIDGKLSLEDAVKISLRYNKTFQEFLEKKEQAKGKLLEASSRALPYVEADGTYLRLDEPVTVNINGSNVKIGDGNNYSIDLSVRQPIFQGGSILSGIRAANLYTWFTDEEIRKQLQITIQSTLNAYFESLLANELFEVNKQAVLTAKSHLKDVLAKKREGLTSNYDVLRAEVEVANFEAEMIAQENRMHIVIAQLLKTLGISQHSDVELSDQLTYVPFSIELEEATHIAFLNRPDLFSSQLVARMQKEAVNVAKGDFYPKLNAGFVQTWGRPGPRVNDLDTWGKKWNFQLNLSWPLFEGFRKYGKLKQEKSLLKQREISHENMKETVIFDVQKAVLSLSDAAKFVESQQADLNRAKKALELVKAGYKEGIKTEVEVNDAIAAMTRSQSLFYKAIFQHSVARLNLDFAMGILGKGKNNE